MNGNKNFGSALEEAVKTHNEKVLIPYRYLLALYFTQLLEIYLRIIYKSSIYLIQKTVIGKVGIDYFPNLKNEDRWNANDYLSRIETFYPKNKYPLFYEKINLAIEKRNDFIHSAFKIKTGNKILINLDMEKFYLDENAQKKMESWIEAFIPAQKELTDLISNKFIGVKLKEV